MKGSKWAVLVVVLLVVGVLAVKYGRRPATSSEPLAVAQAPQVAAAAEPAPVDTDASSPTAAEPAPVEADASSPTASGSPAPKPRASDAAKNPVTPKPAAQTQAPAASSEGTGQRSEPAPSATADPPKSAGPKPEGPLPGSKLGECLKNGRPTMADFGLGTCKWCKMMEPILKQAAQDYWGKANILFIALDKYPDLSREYRIAAMPTQIFFDASGKQVGSHMGFLDRAGIDERLSALGAKLGAKQ